MNSSKGVGTAVGTILIIAIFTAFFAVYLYMANNNIESRTKLNFESLTLMRLKSTFSLFNQSLGTTWFISTVQAAFMTGDESIGCGRSDSSGPVTIREPDYWLQLDPSNSRSLPTSVENGENRIPTTRKHNAQGFNPQICYPRDNHVIDYIKTVLQTRDFLKLTMPRPDQTGGVSITIPRNGDNVASTMIFNLLDDRIEGAFTQTITASYGEGAISRQTTNNNTVFTSLRQIVASGRRVVEALLVTGDVMKGGPTSPPPDSAMPHYTPRGAPGIPPTANEQAYRDAFRDYLSGIAAQNGGGTVTINERALSANTADNSGVLPSSRSPGWGLVLHYDATITYSEPERYYYHDIVANTFQKKRISLRMNVEDYLPAIDCVLWQPPDFPFGNVAQFNWNGGGDMICCAGALFSCNADIPDMPSGNELSTGQRIRDQSDGGSEDQERCNGILGGGTIGCTATGFTIS